MTEKRFTITQDFEEHHRQIRDNGKIIMGCFLEPQAEPIVKLLNELNDENEQLKSDNFNLNKSVEYLDEIVKEQCIKLDWANECGVKWDKEFKNWKGYRMTAKRFSMFGDMANIKQWVLDRKDNSRMSSKWEMLDKLNELADENEQLKEHQRTLEAKIVRLKDRVKTFEKHYSLKDIERYKKMDNCNCIHSRWLKE